MEREAIDQGHSGDRASAEWNDRQWQMSHSVRRLALLSGCVTGAAVNDHVREKAAERYPFSITPYYLSLMKKGEEDPIGLQAVPDPREIDESSGGLEDPLDEERDTVVPGLIHRYRDRCLAMVTSLCAVYCRHCNRKNRWRGFRGDRTGRELAAMIDYIEKTSEIREVILSGGDPLMMERKKLREFLSDVKRIDHVKMIRIGTRIPVVMPMAIDAELCDMLREVRPLWVATQFNHPREITKEAARACGMLLEAGIPLVNQSVLLRGVNDSFETMRDLLYGLQSIAVKPYYLFQCEPVKGAMHFRVRLSRGREIMEALWGNVSGLCVPTYVTDLPGGKGKLPISPLSRYRRFGK